MAALAAFALFYMFAYPLPPSMLLLLPLPQGSCKRGDTCGYAHGVFECWLHPARYRTQLCKEGALCKRSVCFFAHSMDELREPLHLHGGFLPLLPFPLASVKRP